MIYRQLIEDLEKWSQRPNRKPLVLRGARQVGKTTLINEFGKLQFIGLIGGRILTWGRRVPASVLPCWGSRPQHGNALNRRAFACQGIEP